MFDSVVKTHVTLFPKLRELTCCNGNYDKHKIKFANPSGCSLTELNLSFSKQYCSIVVAIKIAGRVQLHETRIGCILTHFSPVLHFIWKSVM